jgi:hypothetical protein
MKAKKSSKFGRLQIYPTEKLMGEIEQMRETYPYRITMSALICTLVEERIRQALGNGSDQLSLFTTKK